jgi:hypothetical protein
LWRFTAHLHQHGVHGNPYSQVENAELP